MSIDQNTSAGQPFATAETDFVNSYDALPYDSHPYSSTHPDHLATIAKLFGMQPPDVDSARVLELGCAAGGNLIPLAVAIPSATFVGIDLSKRQLNDGWKLIGQLGLKNIDLQHRNIADVGPEDGKFDYILCHGVFSWVGREVQQQIFAICSENLSPNGVAYISYNTNPGWYMRGMVRQMMCYHARQFDDPQSQVKQARALLDFLIKAGSAGDEAYRALLNRELEILRNRQDSYLFHEHLEEVNEPLFFYEFIERAEKHGLRYLAETQFNEMVAANFGLDVDRTLRELNVGLIPTEQYLDFLRNRTFRRTLLCHKDITLNRQIGPEQLSGLYVSSALQQTGGNRELSDHSEMSFQEGNGLTVTVSKPLLKATLTGLARINPEPVLYDSLPAFANHEIGSIRVRDAANHHRDLQEIGGMLLEMLSKDLITLRDRALRYTISPGVRPRVSPLIKLQTETQTQVTTLAHGMMQLSDLSRRLVPMLDGGHDRAALRDYLRDLVTQGKLVIEQFGQKPGAAVPDEMLDELLEREIDSLARNAALLKDDDSSAAAV
jgi:methyltransferase-like protein/2-polyprenyl-3-methyl-5-hydroxy-6-metoxy-1,4-benzoquinol methylase